MDIREERNAQGAQNLVLPTGEDGSLLVFVLVLLYLAPRESLVQNL